MRQSIGGKLTETIDQARPATIVGMYDAGTSHLFGTLDLGNMVKIDLAGTSGNVEKEIERFDLEIDGGNNLKDLKKKLVGVARDGDGLVLAINIGFQERISEELLETLYFVRNTVGVKIVYLAFANYSFIKSVYPEPSQDMFDKLFKSNLIYLSPLSWAEAVSVLKKWDLDGKLSEGQIKEIYRRSGGNPGLMRALFVTDEANFKLRLSKIVLELSGQELDEELTKLGYLTGDKKPFCEAFGELMNKKAPLADIDDLSLTQKKLLELFMNSVGKIVDREKIATTLWGSHENKYSDWAIDQAIYSLRQVLKKKSEELVIKSRRGQGYQLIKE